MAGSVDTLPRLVVVVVGGRMGAPCMGPGLVHAAGRSPSHVGTSAWMLLNCYPSFKDAVRLDINTEPVLAGFSTYSVTFSRPSSGDAEDELFHPFCFSFFLI